MAGSRVQPTRMTDHVASPAQPPEVDFVALQPGQTIGRYEIVATLGQGGFGITYRARDSQLDREVAIKEYLPPALAIRQDGTTVLPRTTKLADDFTWGRERFVEEGRTLATLDRAPAIVRVYDFLEANGTAYIVMELVPGETLEHRLKSAGKLGPEDIDRILWPLLDGLELVHRTGYLHRDIKPANILLDGEGRPTLIDFGASRAAMAGRTTALTAIFTPGYAAAEQMTSAKQGPWTDIYGLSATIYHAVTGAAPPSAFDRLLEDTYTPLAKVLPAGFAPGLLVGIDAGLAIKASDRPQAIAGWRPLLGQAGTPETQATVSLDRPAPAAGATVVHAAPTSYTVKATPPPTAKWRRGLWLGLVAVLVALAGGGYYAATRPSTPVLTPEQKAAAEKAEQERQELARLRAEAAARQKVEQDAAAQRQADEQARQKADTEQAMQRQVDAERRLAAEAAEGQLLLQPSDRQRVQAALTALGYDTRGNDGAFNPRTREMIAAWQGAKGHPATGFLTAGQYEAVLREAAPALAAASPAPSPTPSPSPGTAAGVDGLWRGSYHCTPSRIAGDFTMHVQINVAGGTGIWLRPGSGPGTTGNQSLSVKINGAQVVVSRVHSIAGPPGTFATATMLARYENGMITGSGPEQNSGGRTCTINLTR